MSECNIDTADPDNGTYFGMPCRPESAALVLVSAPWDATAPEGSSSSYAPDAIIEESMRMDLYDPLSPDEWRKGIATADIDYAIQETSHGLRQDVERLRGREEKGGGLMGGLTDDYYARKQRRIDDGCRAVNDNIRLQTAEWFERGKIVGLVGGDQSTVYGALQAAARYEKGMGVLHLDARCRMKSRHEGFERSCASVMLDAAQTIGDLGPIVHAGMRDFSATEHRMIRESERMAMFGSGRMARMCFEGSTWQQVCDAVAAKLPATVFVDLDISVLSSDNCPHSPEAEAGGLGFSHAVYLLDRIAVLGRRMAGFALTGVSPAGDGSIDAKIGARLLYRMCGIALRSQNNHMK